MNLDELKPYVIAECDTHDAGTLHDVPQAVPVCIRKLIEAMGALRVKGDFTGYKRETSKPLPDFPERMHVERVANVESWVSGFEIRIFSVEKIYLSINSHIANPTTELDADKQ